MSALRCENRNILIDDESGEIRDEDRGPYRKWQPSTRDQEIIRLAQSGKKPKKIAAEMDNITADIAREVVKRARRNGILIQLFRGDGEPMAAENYARKKQTMSKPVETVKPRVFASVPLNHSELAALKKLCGTDRATIEQAADEEGVSLQQYVGKLLADHAKDLRG